MYLKSKFERKKGLFSYGFPPCFSWNLPWIVPVRHKLLKIEFMCAWNLGLLVQVG